MYKIAYLITDEHKWTTLIGRVNNMLKSGCEFESISIVVLDTAILSCLNNSILDEFKNEVAILTADVVEFYACINTLHKYGITENMLLPDVKVAVEGGMMKYLRLEDEGCRLLMV